MIEYKKFIDTAYKEALKAFERDDVPVGAIIVKDGKIISKAHNQRVEKNNAVYHAEIVAIQRACKKLNNYRLDGCIMYITLEPCLMCTGAIIQSRISKVIFCAKNEKDGAIISKYTILDDKKFSHRPEYMYIYDERCSKILKSFFKKKRVKE